MFQVGEKVKLVRHDQYPQLVGLHGVITALDDLPEGVPPRADTTEPVYQVDAEHRTLYQVPESWLERG